MKQLIFLFLLLLTTVILSQNLEKSYTLTEKSATSAGVYDANDVLLRTLWSNVEKQAGTHSVPEWDGLDDYGNNTSSNGAYIKVISNNIKVEWEGVIGNLSDSYSEKRHKQIHFYQDMLIHEGEAYFSQGWSEGHSPISKSSLESMGSKEEDLLDAPYNNRIAQMTERMATDGERLYMAGRLGWVANISYVSAATFENLHDYDLFESFEGRTVTSINYTFKATDIVDSSEKPYEGDYEPLVTGLAVQKQGDYLFVARQKLNSLHIVHKIDGNLILPELTYNAVKHTKVDADDNLWMVYDDDEGKEIVEKFLVSEEGKLTSTGFTIEGLNNIQAMTFHPTENIIAIADAGISSHQVKGYSTIEEGDPVWVLGMDESYEDVATVYEDKFMFTFNNDNDPYENYIYPRGLKDEYSFLAYEDDGSLWVNDRGNFRYHKFDENRNYVDHMMWQRSIYSLNVDPNKPKRVFYGYLEFEVDYSKPLLSNNSENAWRLKNNWAGGIPVGYENFWDGALENVMTLSNNRTYALMLNSNEGYYGYYSIIELEEGGTIRDTGVDVANVYSWLQLKNEGEHGTFRWVEGVSGVQYFYQQAITGFTAEHNPILGEVIEWGQYEEVDNYVKQDGARRVSGEITSNGNMVIFDGAHENNSGFHLAGWNPTDGFSFKTAKGVVYENGAPYPTDGTYDLRNLTVKDDPDTDEDESHFGVQYRGNVALAMDDWIIWGYNGEFWENRQTNKWHMVSEEGLFLRDFGEATPTGDWTGILGMAGNAFAPDLVKLEGSNDVYLWHNDEGQFGGAHRWKISNLESVQKFDLQIGAVASTEETVLKSMKIYPNPANNQINISGIKSGSYELFDQAGRLYKSGDIVSENQIISTKNITAGIYFIKIINEGKTKVEKIILK